MSKKHFLGLITRCKDEYFIKEFCDYYISQGVDKIFVLDDNSNDKSIYNGLMKNDKVTVFFLKNIISRNKAKDRQMFQVNRLYKVIRNNFEWIISVDVDEFINTRKNPEKTIREELETTYKDVDCIKIPWIMMACNKRNKSPQKVLRGITHRWNHDMRHPNRGRNRKFRCRFGKIEVKCIFKASKFRGIGIHNPRGKIGRVRVVESVDGKGSRLGPFYKGLHEAEIVRANMLCHHYRIISKENCMRKMMNSKLYAKRGVGFREMMMSDHADKVDETLKEKSIKLGL